MTTASDFFLDTPGGDDGQLEARLRGLHWAEAPAEVRERCWRRLNDWMADQGDERPGPGEPDHCDRHPFSRRPLPRGRTLAERWTPPSSDERRATVD
jgi:hypothetical protein